MPAKNPTREPETSERRMQGSPIGPTGVAIEIPRTKPRNKKSIIDTP